ncbi:uncharacterized protein SCHCODRAFT_02645519 [Schizophyllum commune H4-8]|uniref:uncharacterized protein n=1 Tax=Schizophyllum commune (strain H4-8 / FGSC 9210) TaxID=578458 RepID=UPI00215FA4A6|nr:uncharacterized protein SCHCODRAFT_02645519 [Schizophyllum commune H4-8]KAI5884813.1 hypothetical protein SCHCODRAFT_02645519 [Schizophyllum commune H4-8]
MLPNAGPCPSLNTIPLWTQDVTESPNIFVQPRPPHPPPPSPFLILPPFSPILLLRASASRPP